MLKQMNILLAIAALAFLGCSGKGSKKSSKAKPEEKSTSDNTLEGKETVAVDVVNPWLDGKVTVKNYESFFNTYAALTGVDGSETYQGERSVYTWFRQELANALPAENNPEQFGAAGFVAAAKLAGELCDRAFVNAEDNNTQFFGISVDDPDIIFEDNGLHTMRTTMMESFWGDDPSTIDESNSEYVILKDLQEIMVLSGQPEGVNTDEPLRRAGVSACVVGLLSPRTYLN